jgi:excisionase family DNA binding protein
MSAMSAFVTVVPPCDIRRHESDSTANGGHELLTTAEVAERLRVSERTVRRWAAEGTMPAIQLGGAGTHLRIPATALERWLWSSGRQGSDVPRRSAFE